MKKISNWQFQLMMLLTIVVWALAFPFIRASLEGGLSFTSLTTLRFLVVCTSFVFILLIKRSIFSKLQKQDIIPIFLLGFFGVIVYHLGLNYGEQYISAGAASLIIATIPVFVLILAIVFLKEKISSIQLSGILLALTGVVVISIWGQEDTTIDVKYLFAAFAVLIAAIMGAFYTVAGKKLLTRYNALSLTVYAMLLGSIGLLPFIRFSFFEEIFQVSLYVWGAVIFLGVFSTVVGYVLWYKALEIRNASEISVYLYAIPILSTVISYIMFNDEITYMFIVGGALVIIGLFLVNKKHLGKD